MFCPIHVSWTLMCGGLRGVAEVQRLYGLDISLKNIESKLVRFVHIILCKM